MSEMKLRRVTREDKDLLLRWANDKATRESAVHQHQITKEEHDLWFEARLGNPACDMFVYEYDGEPIGQVRVDIDGEIGEVDYSVAPGHRGHGHGKNIVRLVEQYEAGKVEKLVARVRRANVASQHVFIDRGWKEDGYIYYEKSL